MKLLTTVYLRYLIKFFIIFIFNLNFYIIIGELI